MSKHIVIVGGGPAGYVAASHSAALGARVSLVDPTPLGGTCLHRGCIPTKALVEACALLEKMRHAAVWGLRVDGAVEADWSALRERGDKVVQGLRRGVESLMADRSVTHVKGYGRIVDGHAVDVDGVGRISADAVLVCTGSAPILPEAFRVHDARVATSDDLLRWETLPRSLLIVGDGVVACEFAFIMQVLGVAVTVVACSSRPLPFLDRDIAAVVQREMRRRGIHFVGDSTVERLAATPDGVAALADGRVVAEAERALVAIGRRPNTRGLGLEQAGIVLGVRGEIVVDDLMRAGPHGLYAAGDVNGRLALAHAASAQARLAVDHILEQDPMPLDDQAIPWAIFTLPEIGCVGLSEDAANAAGHAVSCGRFDLRGLGKAQVMGALTGMVKVVADRMSGRLLGVHIVGAHASDMVHEAAVLIRHAATAHALAQTVHAHPTLSEALMEAAEDALGQATHKSLKQTRRAAHVSPIP